jgi:predicted phosphodiesterase
MYRIAIISDIHGNIPAFDAVIADIEQCDIDKVFVAGDIVGRGPQGNAAVHRIINAGWTCVRGNHEDYLLDFIRKQVPESWFKLDIWSAARWLAAELDNTAVQYISQLPLSICPTPSLHILHGTPRSNREGIGPWTEDDFCLQMFDMIDESCLVCAHTHRTHHRQLQNGQIVNSGSVGLPFNRDHRAQYAILSRNSQHSQWHIEFRQVPYDREQLLRIYETSGFLKHGGLTAEIIRIEIHHARPYLTPFLEWIEQHQLPPNTANLEAFLVKS